MKAYEDILLQEFNQHLMWRVRDDARRASPQYIQDQRDQARLEMEGVDHRSAEDIIHRIELRAQVRTALRTLRPQARKVLYLRFGIGTKEHTLEEVGRQLKVTRERVRQIERQALRQLHHPGNKGGARLRELSQPERVLDRALPEVPRVVSGAAWPTSSVVRDVPVMHALVVTNHPTNTLPLKWACEHANVAARKGCIIDQPVTCFACHSVLLACNRVVLREDAATYVPYMAALKRAHHKAVRKRRANAKAAAQVAAQYEAEQIRRREDEETARRTAWHAEQQAHYEAAARQRIRVAYRGWLDTFGSPSEQVYVHSGHGYVLSNLPNTFCETYTKVRPLSPDLCVKLGRTSTTDPADITCQVCRRVMEIRTVWVVATRETGTHA